VALTGSFAFNSGGGLSTEEVIEACTACLQNYTGAAAENIAVVVEESAARRLSSLREALAVNESDARLRGSRQLTAQEEWQVSFTILVQETAASAVVSSFDAIVDGGSAAFASLLETTLAEVATNFTGIDFTGFTEVPADPDDGGSVVLQQVAEVEYEEVRIVTLLLESNATKANTTIGNFTIVGVVITEVSVAEDGGSTVIDVGNGITAEIPQTIFDALGLDNTTEQVVVVVSGDVSNTNVAEGDVIVGNNGQTAVLTLLSVNLFSESHGVYSVSGLLEPIILVLPVTDADAICVWWDADLLDWSDEGMTIVNFTGTELVCATTHLTLFAAIVRGFVDTVECSQVTLLSRQGVVAISDGDWATRPLTWILWTGLFLLICFLASAIFVDVRRTQAKIWSDHHLLVPKNSLKDGAAFDENENDAPAVHAATCLSILEVIGIAGKEVLDDLCSGFFEYFAELRDLCEQFREGLRDAWWVSRETVQTEGGYGFTSVVLFILAQKCMDKTAHLNACFNVGMHHEDELDTAAVALDPTASTDDLKGRRSSRSSRNLTRSTSWGRRSLSRAGSLRSSRSSRSSKSADTKLSDEWSPEPISPCEQRESRAEKGYTDLELASDDASGALTNKAGCEDAGSGSKSRKSTRFGMLTGSTSLGVDSAALMNASTTVKKFQQSYSQCFEHEQARFKHSWLALGGMMKPFWHHNPVGQALTFSITVPSSIRALLIVCDLCGAFVITTLFMPSVDAAPSKRNHSSCEDLDVATLLGRIIAIGLIAAFVAALPVTLMSRLHSREICRIDGEEGGEEWNRRLQIWRMRDRAIWVVGLLYSSFSVFFVMLFFANVKEGSHGPWLASAFVTVLNDLLLCPLALVLAAPLLALLCISVLTMLLWKPWAEVIDLISGFSLDALLDGTPTGASSPKFQQRWYEDADIDDDIDVPGKLWRADSDICPEQPNFTRARSLSTAMSSGQPSNGPWSGGCSEQTDLSPAEDESVNWDVPPEPRRGAKLPRASTARGAGHKPVDREGNELDGMTIVYVQDDPTSSSSSSGVHVMMDLTPGRMAMV